jgi:5'-3' exoribonuclease 1
MSKVFAYLDHIFRMVRPRRLLYMAIDGVAPRAKMNQQRSRRFKSAREAEKMRAEALAKGEPEPKGEPFDSNCITPGTPFMARLSEHLRFYVQKKQTEDPLVAESHRDPLRPRGPRRGRAQDHGAHPVGEGRTRVGP